MRYEDEHYVKLYTRDTPTWKAMTWQAKCLFPLLMRKLDGAGLMECGELGRAAVALMVDLPDDLVSAGLASLERLGVLVWHGTTLEAPKFLEAQEARKSEALKKRDQRQKAKDKAKADGLASQEGRTTQLLSHGVPQCPAMSPDVPLQPSPARPLPSPSPSPNLAPVASRPPLALESQEPSAPKKKPADPRWRPLQSALLGAYFTATGKAYVWQGVKDTEGLKRLLATESPDEILARFEWSLAQKGYLNAPTIAQLAAKWNELGAAMPPRSTADPCSEPGCEFVGVQELNDALFCSTHYSQHMDPARAHA